MEYPRSDDSDDIDVLVVPGEQDRSDIEASPDYNNASRVPDHLLIQLFADIEADIQRGSDEVRVKKIELPPHVDSRLEAAKQQAEASISTIRSFIQDLEEKLVILSGLELNDEQATGIIVKIREQLSTQHTALEELSLSFMNIEDLLRQVALETYNDTTTELFTRLPMILSLTRILDGYYNVSTMADTATESERRLRMPSLKDIDLLVSDMMLFHTGNERLGMNGFDKRIALVAKGWIEASRYLSVHQDSMYKPGEKEEVDPDSVFDQYFPEASEAKAKLDLLKQKGVEFQQIRINAGGGDEFAMAIIYTKGKTQELQDAARFVRRHITRSTTLEQDIAIVHQGIAEGRYPSQISEKASKQCQEYANEFHKIFQMLKVEEDTEVTREQMVMANHILERVERSMRLTNYRYKDIITNPESVITMDEALVHCTMEDGMAMFLFGTDSKGSRVFKDSDGVQMGIFRKIEGAEADRAGDPTFEKTPKYDMLVDRLKERAMRELSGKEYDNEELKAVMQSLLHREIVGSMLTQQVDEVNHVGKGIKKANVIAQALTLRDRRALMVVAASLGRVCGAEVTNAHKVGIANKVHQLFLKEYRMICENYIHPETGRFYGEQNPQTGGYDYLAVESETEHIKYYCEEMYRDYIEKVQSSTDMIDIDQLERKRISMSEEEGRSDSYPTIAALLERIEIAENEIQKAIDAGYGHERSPRVIKHRRILTRVRDQLDKINGIQEPDQKIEAIKEYNRHIHLTYDLAPYQLPSGEWVYPSLD